MNDPFAIYIKKSERCLLKARINLVIMALSIVLIPFAFWLPGLFVVWGLIILGCLIYGDMVRNEWLVILEEWRADLMKRWDEDYGY